MAHLITGYAGYEHIQSEDDGAFNAAFFGSGQYVMAFGNQFEGSIINNNTVRILDGDGLMYGRHFRIKPNIYEDVTITTGTAGMNRTDLIVMTYEKNENDGTEQVYLQVIKGPECEGTVTVPEYTNGNILEGATFNQMPLYKVSISGVVLEDIEPMFKVIKTYKQLYEESVESFKKSCETHLDSLGVLDTMEEIEANTQANQLAGALAVKEMQAEHDEDIKLINTNLSNIYKEYTVLVDKSENTLPVTSGYVELAIPKLITEFRSLVFDVYTDMAIRSRITYTIPVTAFMQGVPVLLHSDSANYAIAFTPTGAGGIAYYLEQNPVHCRVLGIK